MGSSRQGRLKKVAAVGYDTEKTTSYKFWSIERSGINRWSYG
jgi:hypothetical protein